MSSLPLQELPPKSRPRSGAVWPAYVGGLLILFGVYRWSVSNVWDGWSTGLAALGLCGLAVWVQSHFSELRRQAGLRGVRYGSQTLVGSALLLAVLAMVNFIVARHDVSFDLTESHLFSISGETRKVLHELPRDVRLLAFFRSDSRYRKQPAELLRLYALESPRLSYEFIDPDQDPDRATALGVKDYETVVLEAMPEPGKPAVSGKPILLEPDPQGGDSHPISEEKLTSALLKMSRGGTKTVYFLEGHGEPDFDNQAEGGYSLIRHALEAQAFLVKRLSLAREGRIPEDCSLLVIAGPVRDLLPAEAAGLQRYLERGGKALVMLDPAPGSDLEPFLKKWGVEVHRDLVVDLTGAGRLSGAGPAEPLVTVYDGQNPITKGFGSITEFPFVRSIWPSQNPGDAVVNALAQTSDGSFSEAYDGTQKHARFDPDHDRRGPIPIAVTVTRAAKEGKEARLVVTGSSRWVSNTYLDVQGNEDLFLRAVNWLVEDEGLISFRPRPQQDHRVQLTEYETRSVFWLVVVLMPLLVLVSGMIVHWRRR